MVMRDFHGSKHTMTSRYLRRLHRKVEQIEELTRNSSCRSSIPKPEAESGEDMYKRFAEDNFEPMGKYDLEPLERRGARGGVLRKGRMSGRSTNSVSATS